MVFKMTQALLLLAAVGSVNGALYTWAGRSTDFSKALNWDGPSPLALAGVPSPGTVSIGVEGAGAVISLLGSNAFNMREIVFDGPATLIFEGGASSVMTFDKDATAQGATAFAPSSDFKCNQNWMITENGVLNGAPFPPCGDDEIIIPAENSYFVEIPKDSSISKVTFLVPVAGGAHVTSVDVTSCGDGNTVTALGSSSSVSFEGGCDTSKLGALASASCPLSSCTTTTTVTTVSVTSVSATSGTFTSATDINIVDGDNDEDDKDGTSTTAVTTVDGAAGALGGGAEGNGALMNTSAGMGIVIGIVLLVLICVVVAAIAFVLMRKKSSKDTDRNVASFDNPLYDDVGTLNINGTSHTTGDGNTGEANGYMDVPGGHDHLYDEVNINATAVNAETGYMDINANEANDDEDDEDFDNGLYDEVDPDEPEEDEDYDDEDNEDI